MSRQNPVIWPVLSLLASFVTIFTLTWVFASDQRRQEGVERGPSVSAPAPATGSPTPAPSLTPVAKVLVVSVTGPEPTSTSPGDPGLVNPVVVGVLERHGNRLCLNAAFATEWRPEDGQGWDSLDTIPCRTGSSGQPLDLRFIRK